MSRERALVAPVQLVHLEAAGQAVMGSLQVGRGPSSIKPLVEISQYYIGVRSDKEKEYVVSDEEASALNGVLDIVLRVGAVYHNKPIPSDIETLSFAEKQTRVAEIFQHEWTRNKGLSAKDNPSRLLKDTHAFLLWEQEQINQSKRSLYPRDILDQDIQTIQSIMADESLSDVVSDFVADAYNSFVDRGKPGSEIIRFVSASNSGLDPKDAEEDARFGALSNSRVDEQGEHKRVVLAPTIGVASGRIGPAIMFGQRRTSDSSGSVAGVSLAPDGRGKLDDQHFLQMVGKVAPLLEVTGGIDVRESVASPVKASSGVVTAPPTIESRTVSPGEADVNLVNEAHDSVKAPTLTMTQIRELYRPSWFDGPKHLFTKLRKWTSPDFWLDYLAVTFGNAEEPKKDNTESFLARLNIKY